MNWIPGILNFCRRNKTPQKRSAGAIPRFDDHRDETSAILIAMSAIPVPITAMITVAIPTTMLMVSAAEVERDPRRSIVAASATNPIAIPPVTVPPLPAAAATAMKPVHLLNLCLGFDGYG